MNWIRLGLQKLLRVPRRCDRCGGYAEELAHFMFPSGEHRFVCSTCWREISEADQLWLEVFHASLNEESENDHVGVV